MILNRSECDPVEQQSVPVTCAVKHEMLRAEQVNFAFRQNAVYKHPAPPEQRTERAGSVITFRNEERSMKQTVVFTLLVAVALALPACKFRSSGIAGSGVRKTEKRELKSFSAIDTTGAYEIHIACQKPASFEIEADDNILPLIKTEVRDGILFVNSDERYHTSKPVIRSEEHTSELQSRLHLVCRLL